MDDVKARIAKLMGQLQALQRRYEAEGAIGGNIDRYLHNLASVQGALDGLSRVVIRDYVMERLVMAEDPAAREDAAIDLLDAIKSYLH
jgi:DNA-binding FrmR family transcriptional regulator